MQSIVSDVRRTAQLFRGHPGLPLVIVLSLGCGIGLSTAFFSVVNGIWLSPWPVHRASDLRVIEPPLPEAQWRFLAERSRSFQGLAARAGLTFRQVGGQTVRVDFVSRDYFRVLEVPLFIGSGFRSEDSASAGMSEAVIGHRFWELRLGADRQIIGKSVVVDRPNGGADGVAVTVVGVAAASFGGTDPLRTDIWLPLSARQRLLGVAGAGSAGSDVTAFGRLVSGTADGAANLELSALVAQSPANSRLVDRRRVRVRGTARYEEGTLPIQTRAIWAILLIGTVFVTLIACANVSNLLMARGYGRRAEFALRLALGAQRAHIVRQLLVESSVLCVVAGIVGLGVASWLPGQLWSLIARSVSPDLVDVFQLRFSLDRRVLAFCGSMGVIACLAFGLAPALRCSDVDVDQTLKDGHGIAAGALVPALLSYQTIVCVMALAIAGLLVRSGSVRDAWAVTRSMDGVSVVSLDWPANIQNVQRRVLVDEVFSSLRSALGGQPVAGACGQPQAGRQQTLLVTPPYFEVVQTRWRAGRPFTDRDASDRVMVVNEAFALRLWQGRSGVGQVFESEGAWDRRLNGRQVVGVVADAQSMSPIAYLPAPASEVTTLLLRGRPDAIAMSIAALKAQLHVGLRTAVRPGREWMAPAIGPALMVGLMTACFGCVALALAAIGLFSFLKFAAERRVAEMGLRRALGAQSWQLAYSLAQPVLAPLARGCLLGACGAACAAAAMRHADLPAGVDPVDLPSYATVAGVIALSFVAASFGPAWRAIRTEPGSTLRSR